MLEEAKRLGLKVKQDKGWSKAVNAEATPIHGVVRCADIAIGDWLGQAGFSVIEMDDHPMILGMDFMRKARAMPIPHLGSMVLMSEEENETIGAEESGAKEGVACSRAAEGRAWQGQGRGDSFTKRQ